MGQGALVRLALGVWTFVWLAVVVAPPSAAQSYAARVEITVKDKKFEPAEVKAPANKRIVIHLTNRDAVAMEFESHALKVEKVIAAHGEGILRVGPLAAGRYDFFDDFNQASRGTLVVE